MLKNFFICISLLLLLFAAAYAEDKSKSADFYFAVITDTHSQKTDGEMFKPFAETPVMISEIIKTKPDFVVHCGDMTSTSYSFPNSDESIYLMWESFDSSVYNPLKHAGIELVQTMGNHDMLRNAAEIYERIWRSRPFVKITLMDGKREKWYSFEHKGCLFVVMNGSALSPSHEQLAWLNRKISDGKNMRAVFVITHIGLKGMPRHPNEHLSAEASDIISGAPYKIYVLSGHHHKYNISEIGNAVNIIENAHGKAYMKVFVKGNSVVLEHCDVGGSNLKKK